MHAENNKQNKGAGLLNVRNANSIFDNESM